MASTAAALNRALVAAVFVVLLHFSMAQSPPTPNCPDYTGQQPVPPPLPPTPAPAPAPPPPTPPAPSPGFNCRFDCATQCNVNCTAYKQNGIAKCNADSAAAFTDCYDSCTAHTCPGKSCEHSGCGSGNCTCKNPNASKCCQDCRSAVGYSYYSCMNTYTRGEYYCMLSCTSACNNNCPQG